MTDQNITTQEKELPTPLPEPQPETDTQPEPIADEKKFSQAELDRIVKERIEREKAKQEKAAADAKKKAEADALAANAEWQKLAEQREAELKQMQERVKAAEVLELKRQAATKHRIPDALIERLKGESAEDIEADAAQLAELLPEARKAPPNLPPTNPSGNSVMSGETPAERNRRLGLT